MIHCVKLKGGGGNSANPDRGGRDPDLLTRKRGWTESEKSWARGVTVSDDFAPLSRNGGGRQERSVTPPLHYLPKGSRERKKGKEKKEGRKGERATSD